MKDKKIRMVIDKKSLLLADENLNITNDIIDLLNKNLSLLSLIKFDEFDFFKKNKIQIKKYLKIII